MSRTRGLTSVDSETAGPIRNVVVVSFGMTLRCGGLSYRFSPVVASDEVERSTKDMTQASRCFALLDLVTVVAWATSCTDGAAKSGSRNITSEDQEESSRAIDDSATAGERTESERGVNPSTPDQEGGVTAAADEAHLDEDASKEASARIGSGGRGNDADDGAQE